MSYSRYGAPPNKRAVNFTCIAPEAKYVTMVGDFNNWNQSSHPLKQLADKAWQITVELKHGHHRYAFLVDGQLTLDPRAMGIARNDQNERVALVAVS